MSINKSSEKNVFLKLISSLRYFLSRAIAVKISTPDAKPTNSVTDRYCFIEEIREYNLMQVHNLIGRDYDDSSILGDF